VGAQQEILCPNLCRRPRYRAQAGAPRALAAETAAQAQAELRRLKTKREDNALPILRLTPKFREYAAQYLRRRNLNPYTYLRDVLTRLPNMTNHQIPKVTPQAWAKAETQLQRQAAS